MIDLQKAIAELISVHAGPGMGNAFELLDFTNETTGRAFATVIATILNGVVSGHLVSSADTKAAVAVLAEKAAEAGVLWASYEWPKAWPQNVQDDTKSAMFGSLDAALRMHEALLPGWAWTIDAGDGATVENRGDFGLMYSADASVGSPSRAWLLAILRALKAKGDA